jgi:hypothetical protein
MLSILHARLRVQRAPGFPCALCFQKANVEAKLGRNASREREGVFCCHCERSEAIYEATRKQEWIASLRSQ